MGGNRCGVSVISYNRVCVIVCGCGRDCVRIYARVSVGVSAPVCL